jgi:hypothetical protein
MDTGPTAKDKLGPRWMPGDTMSVCDGSSCIPLVYQHGTWLPLGPAYPDMGNYKNTSSAPSSPGYGGGGGGGGGGSGGGGLCCVTVGEPTIEPPAPPPEEPSDSIPI